MGNYISHRNCAGKIILPDNTVHIFESPVSVAELMLEHPKHFVVEFQSLEAGNRPAPLPADKKLETKKIYLMLPMKSGKAITLSADEARRFLTKARLVLGSRSFFTSMKILSFFAKICPASVRKGGHEFVLRKKEDLVENCDGMRSESFAERLEFSSRQFSSKGWKPALDTIKEKVVEKKVTHWLF
ncbi:uncharacterized protein LOC143890127 [Tasmannia lanceolata]|uniref:uncharacterized protein LOC143890127 n=1 Tax=Tasmannia lanceolata TaxID=3420 RepID=UPI004062B748